MLHQEASKTLGITSTPQLPFKEPQIPSTRDDKALDRGTLGGLGTGLRHEAATKFGKVIFQNSVMFSYPGQTLSPKPPIGTLFKAFGRGAEMEEGVPDMDFLGQKRCDLCLASPLSYLR